MLKIYFFRQIKRLTALAVLAACSAALAQVCATPGRDGTTALISGVVNSYYPGTGAAVAVGSASIPVGARGPGATTAIAPGDLLIVMQMQGAQIDSSNSDCYGDGVGTAGCATRTTTTASYAGGHLAAAYTAGNWEYCLATTAATTSVGVACAGTGGGTANAYQSLAPSASAGSYTYQIIRVPQYTNVTLAGNVTPSPWDGSTGGVLGLQANGAVAMAGFNLDATAAGFRGGGVTFIAPYGPPIIDPINGSTFYRAVAGGVPGGEREGSFKAEGVAGTPRVVYNGTAQVDTGVDGYPSGSRGRGAPGNAGGGGNNQNGGGGGGGNGGQGGLGGGLWNDASRPTTFGDGGGFGGDGATRAGNNLALSFSRLIMGGGGGAGHPDGGGTSCDLGSWGGSGGGIMLVRAASLSGTGSLISNGRNGFGPNIAGNCTDAAGGGGAGGTIYAAVGSGLAGRAAQANGGNGANSSYTRHGPGGGGGGGAVYYNNAGGSLSVTAAAGTNGLDSPTVAPVSAWFATPGTVSTLTSSSPALTTTCSTLLDVQKTNGTLTLVAGGTTSYTVTFTNDGATAADGSNVKDTPSAGLSCTVTACTPSATPLAGVCPAAAQWPNLLSPGGLVLSSFPAKSSLAFNLLCNVTATGQ